MTVGSGNVRTPGHHICAMEAARVLVGVYEKDDPHFQETGRRVGLTAEQVDKVAAMNDGARGERMHSFAEIAEAVEQWPVAVAACEANKPQ